MTSFAGEGRGERSFSFSFRALLVLPNASWSRNLISYCGKRETQRGADYSTYYNRRNRSGMIVPCKENNYFYRYGHLGDWFMLNVVLRAPFYFPPFVFIDTLPFPEGRTPLTTRLSFIGVNFS